MAERCDNCMALEVELGLAKNKINEQAAQLAEYSRCWAGLNSEVETLRMWQANVLKVCGLEQRGEK